MKQWLLKKWDWWIYRRAVHSIRRIGERDPAYVRLIHLQTGDWLEKHPLPDELQHAADTFHNAIKNHKPH